jgi:hypothetical protein
MIECDRGFPVAETAFSGWLDGDGARVLRTALLDCLAEGPAAMVVDLGDAAGVGDEAVEALRDVCRVNAEWPAARVLLCPLNHGRSGQFRRAGLQESAEFSETCSAAHTLAGQTPVPRRVQRHLPPAVDAPGQARAEVARACDEWDRPDLADQGQVVASELITNAVMHAATEIDFTVMLREDDLSIAVADRDPRPPRRWADVSTNDPYGRGAVLLDALTRAWGSFPRRDGKVVWAVL